MEERLYSLVVFGWERDKDSSPGEHIGQRGLRVVAASNEEAIFTAKLILDPEGDLKHWAVVDGAEVPASNVSGGGTQTDWTNYRRRTSVNS